MKNLCLLIVLTLITSSIIAQTNIRKGSSSYGSVLYNTDGKIPTAILIYVIE